MQVVYPVVHAITPADHDYLYQTKYKEGQHGRVDVEQFKHINSTIQTKWKPT